MIVQPPYSAPPTCLASEQAVCWEAAWGSAALLKGDREDLFLGASSASGTHQHYLFPG